MDKFESTFVYDGIHNMKSNTQVRELINTASLDPTVDRPAHSNHAWSYIYQPARPHQATRIGDTGLGYDLNGNTVVECKADADQVCAGAPLPPGASPPISHAQLRRLAWNEENWLQSVVDGGGQNVTRFLYDAAGQRVVKQGHSGTSISVGQFYGLKNGVYASKHIFAGSTRLATKLLPVKPNEVAGPGPDPVDPGDLPGCVPSDDQPNKCTGPVIAVIGAGGARGNFAAATYYFHPDHLGSTSWMTDQSARVQERVEYYPYGEVWREDKEERRGNLRRTQQFLYTSKELDEETGLTYFGARYYDSKKARWMSADPLFLEQGVLGLSPFQYAFWSPVVHTDPDGRAVGPRIDYGARREAWSKGQEQLEQGCASGGTWSCFRGWVNQAFEPSPPSQLDASLMAFEITPSPLTVASPIAKTAAKVVTSASGKLASKTTGAAARVLVLAMNLPLTLVALMVS